MARIHSGLALPIAGDFKSEDEYIGQLLAFATTNRLLQLLTSGIHVLDFFTDELDLYEAVLPDSWRTWFAQHEIADILDFVLSSDLSTLAEGEIDQSSQRTRLPVDLVKYVWDIRRLLLAREQRTSTPDVLMPYHIALGMKVKKVHEVGCFAQYIDKLAADLSNVQQQPVTHLIDFGAGQNYLGRALSNPPIDRKVVAVESRAENVESAKRMDLPGIKVAAKKSASILTSDATATTGQYRRDGTTSENSHLESGKGTPSHGKDQCGRTESRGGLDDKMRYIGQKLENGDLSGVVHELSISSDLSRSSNALDQKPKPDGHANLNLMVISLHSCGNLSHHGLRSLIDNEQVSAVAIVGCCYNLATERLSKPPSSTLEGEESRGRLHDTAGDPLGFPMSDKLYTYPVRPDKTGIHLNLTARMMAVQAPANWTLAEFDDFTTRHFYRSLFQKVLLDHGLVARSSFDYRACPGFVAVDEPLTFSAASGNQAGPQIIVGKLGKRAFQSFAVYVRMALARLISQEDPACQFRRLQNLITDAELEDYETRYASRRKDMGVLWTLMAYSAGIVEAIIVVDRWQWLREQEQVGECWVEPVFEYSQSPRNLVVVGIKK